LGNQALLKEGAKTWCRHVAEVVALFSAALEPDEVVLGGNVKRLEELPPKSRAGDNYNAFLGGFRLWDAGMPPSSPRPTIHSRSEP
jgi:polyphosphate glucokinase